MCAGIPTSPLLRRITYNTLSPQQDSRGHARRPRLQVEELKGRLARATRPVLPVAVLSFEGPSADFWVGIAYSVSGPGPVLASQKQSILESQGVVVVCSAP